MGAFNGNTKLKIFKGSTKVKKAYLGKTKIYSAGNIVTYYVDSSTYYQEEVDSDASCLQPTTFTPTKSGWTFIGWREDTTASSSVLSSKAMGDEPITLYAVFEKALVQTFVNGNGTTTQTSYMYYNNGNTGKSSFTAPTVSAKSGWTARGWSDNSTDANASVYLTSGQTGITASVENTFYALYQQTVTLSYNGNGSTSGSVSSHSGTRYYNAYGNTSNPTFTLKSNGFSRADYSFTGWNLGAVGATITLSSDTTAYAQWSIIQRSWLMSGWTAQVREGKCSSSVNSSTSKVYAQITQPYNEDTVTTLWYISPEIDITNYGTLSYAGNFDFVSGVTDHYKMRIYLLNSSGSIVATIYTSGLSDANFSSTFNLASYSGKHKIAISLGAYCYGDDGWENKGTNATLTKATLT